MSPTKELKRVQTLRPAMFSLPIFRVIVFPGSELDRFERNIEKPSNDEKIITAPQVTQASRNKNKGSENITTRKLNMKKEEKCRCIFYVILGVNKLLESSPH